MKTDMDITSKASRLSKSRESLRTIIPKEVRTQLDIKQGDTLHWKVDTINNKIEITITGKRKREKGKTKEEQRELRHQKSIRNRTNRQRKIIQ